jgi:CHAD domain-containing protein
MKQKEIEGIIESRSKRIDKLFPKIIKEFDAGEIHKFRIQVKKLRAFLRLAKTEKNVEGALLPKLLKAFYRYVGIIRNIQLHTHALSEYITNHEIEKPSMYFKILDREENHWKKEAQALMEDNNFDDVREKILKQLTRKLRKSSLKKFAKEKPKELKKQLEDLKNDNDIHKARKILKDILYTLDYIKEHAELPEVFSKNKLKPVTSLLGDFRDKCIELEFLQTEYLHKVKDENELHILRKIKDEFQREKQLLMEQLHRSLGKIHTQL